MKKRENHILKSISLFALVVLTIVACERDFTSIDSDIEGIKNFNTTSKQFPIIAYNKKIDPVQTNNLTSNLLGVYDDPIYGQNTASIVSQVVPTAFDPDFGENPEIESVILNIPYFVTNEGSDAEGNSLYTIDSLYGAGPINLYVYQNNYFLRDFDPESDLEEAQKYYSNANQTINFDNHVGLLLHSQDNFIPSASETIIEEYNEETEEYEEIERIAPSLRVSLSNSDTTAEFWSNLLFAHQDMPELSNQNNFKNFFRGLYIKAEPTLSEGNMLMLNLANGSITVNYTHVIDTTIDDTGSEVEEREDGVFTLTFSGNKLNILESDPTNSVIDMANTNADPVNGDESLYLKGGEGAMGIIDLFKGETLDEDGNTVDALEYFKSKKNDWLINEANLVFYVNQNIVDGQEPDRVTLYDINNKVPLVDYFFDSSTNSSNPLFSKTNFSKILTRDDSNNGVKYKIRVTEHLNNILLRDSTNVKLGLYVTTNINEIATSTILNSDEDIEPTGSVLSPRGTVLYGNTQTVPEEKRAHLEIYYTDPEN